MSPTTIHNCARELIRRGDAYVGRGGKSLAGQQIEGCDGYFGNPYRITPRGQNTRDTATERFEVYARERLETDLEWRRRVRGLYGRRLFCWCKPARCHAEVLAQLAKELHDEETAADRMADDGGPA